MDSEDLFNPRDINCREGDIFPEPSGRSGSSAHLETHPVVTATLGSSDYFDINPDIVDGRGGHKNSEIHSSVFDIDSNKHMVKHPNNPFYQSDLVSPTKKLRSFSSSSSSISSEDLFQVDTKGLSNSRLCTTSSFKDEDGTQLASKDDKKDVRRNTTYNSSELKNASPRSPSTGPQITCELPTQSPTIQVMDRSGEFDPLRIPSSVFDSGKSATPLDWSVASNESLFSIQLGNNSFSRDQILVLGSELFKSGEITKSSESLMFSPSPSPSDKRSFELEKGGATGESDEIIKGTTRAIAESQSKEKPPSAAVKSHSYSMSDESTISSRSFAFPIKKKKKKKCAWPSCYCSNCSCTFCYCRWPSCYFRWPSCYCSNCSWAFCYCWNCSKKRWCCHSSTILTGGEKNGSVKVDAEKQQQQTPVPEVTSKSTGCNWFRCCSPRPSCCHSCCHFHPRCCCCC